jgi:crossover junction endodeoxyribonuclease RusA
MLDGIYSREDELKLPWPNRQLSPNALNRTRWNNPKRLAAKKEARRLGYLVAHRDYGTAIGKFQKVFSSEMLRVTIDFHPPDRRKRDIDNALASMKHYIDGVCDALQIDDKQFKAIVLHWKEPLPKKGQVIMNIEVQDE